MFWISKVKGIYLPLDAMILMTATMSEISTEPSLLISAYWLFLCPAIVNQSSVNHTVPFPLDFSERTVQMQLLHPRVTETKTNTQARSSLPKMYPSLIWEESSWRHQPVIVVDG